ncbi:DsbE family thiol:disulfide interchange protein [Spongiibacter sp. KMU-158]|uniref:DsbE family thiol:disulfide interchange protein n=1 Tax=Spongiibacter pelagi TaxID=2760804 RepID=A0A927C1I9_9GAMM|nr:DsbE family thiol:disulfide interchange protein [Spongiibacter pelagi]MBD2859029.1 DsbE family thiol:disulfide interchange protein [Spongiibacter pelagi]
MQRLKLFLPLIIFILMALLFLGVQWRVKNGEYSPTDLPSALINKPMPSFRLPTLDGGVFSAADLPAEPVLVNVWATWCPTCHYEHPFLMKLAEQGVKILGVDYKDDAQAAQQLLDEKGDPYFASVADQSGQLGLDLGVTGAPETYLLDAQGTVLFRYQGALDQAVWDKHFVPRLAELKTGAGK